MVTYCRDTTLGQESVAGMSRSDVVQVRMASREKHYRLKQDC
ncbi:MAG TPA: hypothetical protein VJA21_05530 [Verrucomicrobiae bacterium]